VPLLRRLARHLMLPTEHAVLVTLVDADSPAGRAGVREGDFILRLDEHWLGESTIFIGTWLAIEWGSRAS
jgi:hypothetical protein